MQERSIGNALAIALISILLIIGSLSISLVEFVPESIATATNIVPPSPILLTVTSTPIPTETPLIFESPIPTTVPTETATIFVQILRSCPQPIGWGQVVVQLGDTLGGIAIRYRVSEAQLRAYNCLIIDSLVAGTVLYVPPVPTNTYAICNPGSPGWLQIYTVRPGDTIYGIAINHYTVPDTLKNVNCRGSDRIYAGEMLWVPNVATRTPYPTPKPGNTAIIYPTELLTETALPFTVTVLPSYTPVPSTPTPFPTSAPPEGSPTSVTYP